MAMQGDGNHELETHLEEATRFFRLGLIARSQSAFEEAVVLYLRAAEQLFLAAQISSGALRKSRKRLAQSLLDEALQLQHSHPKTGARKPSGQPNLPPSPTHPAISASLPAVSDQEPGPENWLVQERPQVRFSDVAGLEIVKEQVRLKLIYPFTHPEAASRYGIQAGGGILLYGPPGTGKTLIARAVAGEIDAVFFTIKPSEVMSQWVGVAEQNIARLFTAAGSYPRSVIFIDEMEALSPRRRQNASTVMARVVPQLLAELDGFHQRQNALLLIGATNEPWAIDHAILRPGRLDRLIYVPPPDLPARRHILELNLADCPLSEEVDLDDLAARTERFSGADVAALARSTRERVFCQAVKTGVEAPLRMEDFLEVLSEMKPSISEKDLRLFEAFKNQGIQ